MGKISNDTYRKLVLLYLISKFEKGIWGNYKFQKTLYYGLVEAKKKPFKYEHTKAGMFSQEAWDIIDGLKAVGAVIDRSGDLGRRIWQINPEYPIGELNNAFEESNQELATALKKSAEDYCRMTWEELKKKVEADPILQEVSMGEVIFNSNIPESIEIGLDEDECEDLELSLNRQFIQEMSKFVKIVEESDFDAEEIKTVAAFI